MKRLVFACLLAATLTACESVAPIVSKNIDPARVSERHARLVEGLASWTLEGRISVRFEDEAWHAGLLWHQIHDIYQIRIIAPFGQGGAQLDGSANSVVLHDGTAEYHSNSASQLLADQFGWRIPVEGLRYWATGRVAPGQESTASYDADGRLATLKQGDWQVDYRGYEQVGELALPAKIFLKHTSGLDVRLVVDNWKTRQEQVAGG